MGLEKNQIVRMEITGTGSDGSGVGRADGMAVFVPRSAVGDLLDVHILKVRKNFAYGKIKEIVKPSFQRTEPDCGVYRRCGGCAYRQITYDAECSIKQRMVADAFQRIGGIELELNQIIPAVQTDRYRNKAQYPLGQDRQGGVIAGFYARNSHRIVSGADCRLHPEEFSEILSLFIQWADKFRIPVYNEQTGEGLLRHLYLRKAFATGQILVVPVVNGEGLPHAEELISILKDALGGALTGVLLNINRKNTNVVLGDASKTLYGNEHIEDRLCGLKFLISPLSFYQVNRDMAEILYKKAAEYARPAGKTVLDLYCGAGAIGLSMAGAAEKIIGVEVVPQAIEDARRNAEKNDILNAEFICDRADHAAEKLKDSGIIPDVVILDPPRGGCDPALIGTVAKGFQPDRVVYVSCNPATLARDLKLFWEYGYLAEQATPVDLFPRTPHVETIVLLQRQHT